MSSIPPVPFKGRGSPLNPPGRFESTRREAEDDGWSPPEDGGAEIRPRTHVADERARTIISRNDSPDIGFAQSLNPYRGCEHGCSYCFARPNHAYVNLSPGLDFETRLFAKRNAAEVLEAELAKPGYRCSPITIGTATDPYQPIERRYAITRAVLEVCARTRHPIGLITKNALVERDLDLLTDLARDGLVRVFVSVTSLDNQLSSRLEPRASAPHRRLEAIRALSSAGVPVGVLVAPVIPMVTDRWLEEIVERAHDAGARSAGYVLIRLPHEVKDLFRAWLATHLPERADHVISLIRQMRGGRDYDARFGARMRGEGAFADLIAARFGRAQRRFGFGEREPLALDATKFVPLRKTSPQRELF